MNAEEYGQYMRLALRKFDDSRPRSLQSAEYRLGVSDIGHCPQYAVNVIKQTPASDAPDRTAALWGTFLHDGIEEAMKHLNPALVCNPEVLIELPNGVSLTGHPDRVDQAENSVTDDKTVNGTGLVARKGPSEQQEFQVAMYALGCVQKGLLDPSKPIIVRIVWHDRSGKQSDPVVWQKVWSPADVDPAVDWLDSVIYAVKHGEDAERVPPVDMCANTCQFYSTCRLPNLPEVDELIEDPRIVEAVTAYLDGQQEAKQGKELQAAAHSVLTGIAGIVNTPDGRTIRLRWIGKPATDKQASSVRIDVREI